MHSTEVKTEILGPQQHHQLSHHNQSGVISSSSPTRRMTNGEGVITSVVGSRHLRDGASAGSGLVVSSNECAGCGKRITDRFLLKAMDLFWHEDCLKCGCCDCRLGEVGSTLYTKANLILCKRDYLRLFGNTGYCAACSKVIPAFEMVMRARGNVYHLECFACQQCNHRFCVGDRFYLCENKILCEYDYEERMVFANMTCSPGNLAILRSQDQKMSNSSQNNNNTSSSQDGVLSSPPESVQLTSPPSIVTSNNTSNLISSQKFQTVSPPSVVGSTIPSLHMHHPHHPSSIVPRPVT